jgi:hypothetical protein
MNEIQPFRTDRVGVVDKPRTNKIQQPQGKEGNMTKTAKSIFTSVTGRIVRFGAANSDEKQLEPTIMKFVNDDKSESEVCYFDIRLLGTGDKVKVTARGDELFEMLFDGTRYDYNLEKELVVPKPTLGARVRLQGYLKDSPPYKHDDGRVEKQSKMNIAGDESFEIIQRKRKRKKAQASSI